MFPKRFVPAVAVVGCGALLAACGGSPTASHPTTPHHKSTRPSTSTTTSTTAPPGSTTPTSTTPTSTVATTATCSTGVLQVAPNGVATSAGTTRLRFTLTNGGPEPCTLEGYPTVTLYGTSGAGGAGAGKKLSFADIHLGGPPTPVTVPSGGTARFVLSVAEVPVNGVACVNVASLEISPPGSAEALSLPDSFEACGTDVGVYPVTASGG